MIVQNVWEFMEIRAPTQNNLEQSNATSRGVLRRANRISVLNTLNISFLTNKRKRVPIYKGNAQSTGFNFEKLLSPTFFIACAEIGPISKLLVSERRQRTSWMV